MQDACQPIVVPRVYALKQSGTLRLDQAVRCYAGTGGSTMIALTGGPGSGKSTAIEYLRTALPPRPPVSFFDEPLVQEARQAARSSLVIFSSPEKHKLSDLLELRLAPWGTDEFIEYLLATNRARVKSVMARLEHDQHRSLIGGAPELWRPMLDAMAADESISNALGALRRVVDQAFPHKLRTRAVIDACYERLDAKDAGQWPLALRERLAARWRQPPPAFRHRAARLVVLLDSIVSGLTLGRRVALVTRALPHDLISLCGHAASNIGAVRAALIEMLADKRTTQHGTIASILHASGSGWEFPPEVIPSLNGAHLAGAWFRKQNWPGLSATQADLDGADLAGCNLDGASFEGTSLRGARLTAASLVRAAMWGAALNGANLSEANLTRAFVRSDLEDADLSGATLTEAEVNFSRLKGARFVGAILRGAEFVRCALDDADFSRADLTKARFNELSFRSARIDAANFSGATIRHCDLEGVACTAANFGGARFESVDLTSSHLPRANFRDAALPGCGLAEIDWEGADLRGADLRGVTFHAGSSRSGLVGSPLACEGSRTGFYTDESNEQDFKAPEQIRKANLCGADLRGARIDGVDFYLVDLRGAQLDPAQLDWLRLSGAILESRA